MKRFKYSLETVLDYKTQVLDNLKTEHAAIVRNVNQKKEEIEQLKEQLNGFQYGFDCTKTQGASIESYWLYDRCIEGMEKKIDEQKVQLNLLERQEEQKKNEVVAANIDTSRYEKLKGRRFNEHQKAEMKEEEAFMEEFVIRGITVAGKMRHGGRG